NDPQDDVFGSIVVKDCNLTIEKIPYQITVVKFRIRILKTGKVGTELLKFKTDFRNETIQGLYEDLRNKYGVVYPTTKQCQQVALALITTLPALADTVISFDDSATDSWIESLKDKFRQLRSNQKHHHSLLVSSNIIFKKCHNPSGRSVKPVAATTATRFISQAFNSTVRDTIDDDVTMSHHVKDMESLSEDNEQPEMETLLAKAKLTVDVCTKFITAAHSVSDYFVKFPAMNISQLVNNKNFV
ncbi:unnamed protein product, partial [Didymodactylos carnosus]